MSLFWRTFAIVGSLLAASLLLALATVATLEEGPRAQRLGLQIASLVNMTRNALVSSQAQRRIELLQQINVSEGARVQPKEPNDKVIEAESKFFVSLLNTRLRELLGANTQVARVVNGETAFWVSFNIDTDEYWLAIDQSRLQATRPNFLLLGLAVVLMALICAWLVSRVLNRPLQELASAVNSLNRGEQPKRLIEQGPSELASLNRQFNRFAQDLVALESDRAVALAGISHDIRTPLTRLRLELELSSKLSLLERESMSEEIERIDRVVTQFIDFARHENKFELTLEPLEPIVTAALRSFSGPIERAELQITTQGIQGASLLTSATELERILSNCIGNAHRYGQSNGVAQVLIRLLNNNEIQVLDNGPGVPKPDLERILRPFARLDSERSLVGGSGLGLAIVDRLVHRLGGQIELKNAAHPEFRGLCVHMKFAASKK